MSFPSGSTLLVTLLNGASPNTGPFDLYINSISSSANLITTASVPKVQLSGSGYTFNNNVEVFSVWAKSSGSITTANVASLGNIPGTNSSVSVTGSYDSSLNVSLVTASVFFNMGYGLQNAGAIPSALNTCPSTTGVGTGSINSSWSTLVVCKTHETSSEYIKFFPQGGATSDYFYHIPSTYQFTGSLNVCVDLSSTNYQTVATNSINVYPTASITMNSYAFPSNAANTLIWNILKVNGSTVYSSSAAASSIISVPGNALVEITASSLLGPGNTGSYNVYMTNYDYFNYAPIGLVNSAFYSDTVNTTMNTASAVISDSNRFYATPGGNYNLVVSSSIVGDPVTTTLTYGYSGNASGPSTFTFDLSDAIPSTAFTISNATVDIFPDGTCLGSIDSDSLITAVTMSAGLGTISGAGTGNVCGVGYSYRKNNGLTINGTFVASGNTILIGGTTLTVSTPIAECNLMGC